MTTSGTVSFSSGGGVPSGFSFDEQPLHLIFESALLYLLVVLTVFKQTSVEILNDCP